MFAANDLKLKEICLNKSEWAHVQKIVFLLQPLYFATVALSKSKFTSLSATLPIYVGLVKVYKSI